MLGTVDVVILTPSVAFWQPVRDILALESTTNPTSLSGLVAAEDMGAVVKRESVRLVDQDVRDRQHRALPLHRLAPGDCRVSVAAVAQKGE